MGIYERDFGFRFRCSRFDRPVPYKEWLSASRCGVTNHLGTAGLRGLEGGVKTGWWIRRFTTSSNRISSGVGGVRGGL